MNHLGARSDGPDLAHSLSNSDTELAARVWMQWGILKPHPRHIRGPVKAPQCIRRGPFQVSRLGNWDALCTERYKLSRVDMGHPTRCSGQTPEAPPKGEVTSTGCVDRVRDHSE